jgi:flagellar basal body-associated protein FliL
MILNQKESIMTAPDKYKQPLTPSDKPTEKQSKRNIISITIAIVIAILVVMAIVSKNPDSIPRIGTSESSQPKR